MMMVTMMKLFIRFFGKTTVTSNLKEILLLELSFCITRSSVLSALGAKKFSLYFST